MKKLSFINKIIFLLNTFFTILLLLSYFVPYIKPSSISISSLLSLATPILIIVNVLFLIYWIIVGFKKQFILSLLILIVGFFVSPPIYKFGSKNDNADNMLNIMTYNVRKFNIFKWIDDKNISSKIDSFILNEKPDLITLQEFKEDENFKIDYPFSYNPTLKTKVKSGLAIFSKYAIINSGIVEQNRRIGKAIFADIVKNKDTIRVYNFHLQSLGVIPDEEFFGHSDSKKLIQRLRISFEIQQQEIDKLKSHINNCNYRVIIAGDMNNTAYSWSYKNLKNDLKDSFLEAGGGFGKTYSFKGFPLRIDFIFAHENLKIINHKNYKVRYSDNFHVMATIEF